MALAEKLLAAEFNRDGHAIVDHHTYVFLGDGCLMEGISHEACALAGAWKLDKLIAIYDDNGISIDGQVAPWFIDDTPKRFEAYGWHVIGRRRRPRRRRGRRARSRKARAQRRQADADRAARRTIGKGAPNRAGTAKAHGEALGADEVKRRARRSAGRTRRSSCPTRSYAAWDAQARAAPRPRPHGDERFAAYARRASRARRRVHAPHGGRAAGATSRRSPSTRPSPRTPRRETVATRKASQIALEAFTRRCPRCSAAAPT